MLPDFRFVLGAILAIALPAVAGLGLVTSVKLAQEARMNPIEDARSLAFAGHAQWNQFYDPDGARRFEGLGGNAPATPARLEAPAEISEIAAPVAAPVMAPTVIPNVPPEDQTASLPAHQPDPVMGAVDPPNLADEKPPASDPSRTDSPQLPETAAAVTMVGALAPEVPAPPGASAPSAERVASAPTLVPGSDLRQEPQAEPRPEAQAPLEATVDPLQNPPTPRMRPKPLFHRRIVRAHIHRVAPVSQQTTQNAGFPPSPSWPGYDNQYTGANTANKTTGRLPGTLTNRPQ
jgi:hypothetical protein